MDGEDKCEVDADDECADRGAADGRLDPARVGPNISKALVQVRFSGPDGHAGLHKHRCTLPAQVQQSVDMTCFS